MKIHLFLFVLICCGVSVFSQKPLRDINLSPAGLVSVSYWGDQRCFRCGNNVYFIAKDSLGSELWKTDGTNAGTKRVIDLNPGPGDGVFETDHVWCLNGITYFRNFFQGAGLWKTDGTASGTVPVSNTMLAPGDIWFYKGDIYYFTVGLEFWATSANLGGDRKVNLIAPGDGLNFRYVSVQFSPEFMYLIINVHNNSGIDRNELWKSDGTTAGTRKVATLQKDTQGSTPKLISTINNKLIFLSWDADHGNELWASDGTEAGTKIISDLNPGTANSEIFKTWTYNDKLIFADFNFNTIVTDGSAQGTIKILSNISTRTGSAFQNAFYFVGNSRLTDDAMLFKTDGTIAGTIPIDSVGPSLFNDELLEVNGKLLLRYHNSAKGVELGVSMGTAGSTQVLKDINPGAHGSDPRWFAELNGKIIFVADDGSHGYEVWATDGTPTGTTFVKDVVGGTQSANIDRIFSLKDGLYFLAGKNQFERDLWSTDGTSAGTSLRHTLTQPTIFGTTDDYLVVNDHPSRFLRLNSTSNELLWDYSSDYNGMGWGPNPGLTADDIVYMKVRFNGDDEDIWRVDATTKSVTPVITAGGNEIPSSNIFKGSALGKEIVFTAEDNTHGNEVWITRQGGTVKDLLMDIKAGSQTSFSCCFVTAGDKVFFGAEDAIHSRELWVTDGTINGTKMVKDLAPGNAQGFTGVDIAAIGNSVIFNGYDGTDNEPWISNGTEAGTHKLKDLNPASSFPTEFTSIDGKVYFSAADGSHGAELYVTDGTEANTKLIDVVPGTAGSNPTNIIKAGNAIYFYSDKKIWRTMGTTETSELASEIEVLSPLYSFDDHVCFVAQDKLIGREIFGLDVTKFNQTINHTPIGSHVLGSPPVQIAASATSGLSVIASSSNSKVAIDGLTLTFQNAGKATISLSQAGNLDFNAAPVISETICVNPPKPEITADFTNPSQGMLTSNSTENNTWYRNDVLISQTSRQLTVTEEGIYKLKVLIDGCESEPAVYEVAITAIPEKANTIAIYPNPTEIHINTWVPFENTTRYQIFDFSGRIIHDYESSNHEEQFDMASFPTGIYSILIRNGSTHKNQLIIKR